LKIAYVDCSEDNREKEMNMKSKRNKKHQSVWTLECFVIMDIFHNACNTEGSKHLLHAARTSHLTHPLDHQD